MINRRLLALTLVDTLIALVATAVYMKSLTLPAFRCGSSFESWSGFDVLIGGWIGLIFFDFRWLANLLFLGMLILPFLLRFVPARSRFLPYISLLLPAIAGILVWASATYPSMGGCGESGGTAVGAKALGAGGILWVQVIAVLSVTYSLRVLLSPLVMIANQPLHAIAPKRRSA